MKVNLSKKEKELLIQMAIVLAVLFAAFKGIEYAAANYSEQQRGTNRTLKKQQSELRERLATINEEEALQQEYAVSYTNFVEAGIVGEEPRLEWIGKLQEIARKRRLYDITYRIGNQVSHAPESIRFTKESSISIQTTPMDIKMPMLHDLDFLMFLEDYAKSAPGTFIPIRCKVEHRGRGELQFEVELRENFSADCRIEWLSASDPERGDKENQEEAEQV